MDNIDNHFKLLPVELILLILLTSHPDEIDNFEKSNVFENKLIDYRQIYTTYILVRIDLKFDK